MLLRFSKNTWLMKWEVQATSTQLLREPQSHSTFKCLVLCQELVFTQQLNDSKGLWLFYYSWKKKRWTSSPHQRTALLCFYWIWSKIWWKSILCHTSISMQWVQELHPDSKKDLVQSKHPLLCLSSTLTGLENWHVLQLNHLWNLSK